MQMNIEKIIYLNYEDTYEDMIDHHSYAPQAVTSEIKA